MRRARLEISVSCIINIPFQESEKETLQELIDQINNGDPPPWITNLVKTTIVGDNLREPNITSYKEFEGSWEPDPEEELDFG
ncbi:hypothetical protein COY23_03500 [bacterium (Candidatus Torokbacteria) CG_4_10_14_0_2_um_filter_35_8]|nr:MAG: hypothetical protein COY23_03500 [bacterium (Candidatus Torokbacteria) CG_4_10_14_0_2_um_filter_35_8]